MKWTWAQTDSNYGGHIYIIVRLDLSPSQQAVQGMHAAIEITRSGCIPNSAPHPHIVLCGVRDESALLRQCERLQMRDISFSCFTEPDRDDELTAIAPVPINGDDRKVFRKLKLVKG